MTAYRQCKYCEAEFTGHLRKDEDGMVFVAFDVSPFAECGVQGCCREICDECERICEVCSMLLCKSHAVQTEDGPMCARCAGAE